MHLDRFYEVSQAPDIVSFERHLADMATNLDFGIISGVLRVENPIDKTDVKLFSFGNTPQAYTDAYFDKDATDRDPVSKAIRSSSVPFCYNQNIYLKAGAIDLWEQQSVFGYKNGIGVGLHLSGHKHFMLGMDRDFDLPSDGNDISRMIGQLQLLAAHAQAAVVGLLLPSIEDAPPRLTQRELEILRWARDGKTYWEIGRIMGISEDGVKFHVRGVFRKLDTPNRSHAVLKAIQLGLL